MTNAWKMTPHQQVACKILLDSDMDLYWKVGWGPKLKQHQQQQKYCHYDDTLHMKPTKYLQNKKKKARKKNGSSWFRDTPDPYWSGTMALKKH